MANSAGFWNLIARRYARQPIADEASYEKKLDITRNLFRPTFAVLELGCGTGSTALVHAPYVKHIDAIDFSHRMIAIAEQKRLAAGVDNVRFRCAAIPELEPAAAQYDVILALSVLHLLSIGVRPSPVQRAC